MFSTGKQQEVRVYILALQVFDHLGFDGFRVCQFDHADGYGSEFRQLRRS